MRCLIVVTHLLGTGHLIRALALAKAFRRHGHLVTLISGGSAMTHLDVTDIDFIQLPSVKSDGINFSNLLDEFGNSIDAGFLENRGQQLNEALSASQPDLIITELFPFGRRVLKNEFLQFLKAAKQINPAPKIVCSIRDILEPPSKAKKRIFCEEVLCEYYDGVLVHSNETIMPLEKSWPVGPKVKKLLHYTGYLTEPVDPPANTEIGRGEILVSAGGGPVGKNLFETVIKAAKIAPPDWKWRLLIGGKDKFETIQTLSLQNTSANCLIESVRKDFGQLLHNASCFVGLCGYNTALDILQTGIPAVFVPFDEGGESEQTLRARALSSYPAINQIKTVNLSPELLINQIAEARKFDHAPLDFTFFNGDNNAVKIAEQIVGQPNEV